MSIPCVVSILPSACWFIIFALGVKVRILTPEDELILETERKVKIVQESRQPHEKIGIIHSTTFTN